MKQTRIKTDQKICIDYQPIVIQHEKSLKHLDTFKDWVFNNQQFH